MNNTRLGLTVGDLIKILKKYPKDMKIVYDKYSEQCLLEEHQIETKELCRSREDGWVENKRPDKETETYLVLPGN